MDQNQLNGVVIITGIGNDNNSYAIEDADGNQATLIIKGEGIPFQLNDSVHILAGRLSYQKMPQAEGASATYHSFITANTKSLTNLGQIGKKTKLNVVIAGGATKNLEVNGKYGKVTLISIDGYGDNAVKQYFTCSIYEPRVQIASGAQLIITGNLKISPKEGGGYYAPQIQVFSFVFQKGGKKAGDGTAQPVQQNNATGGEGVPLPNEGQQQ